MERESNQFLRKRGPFIVPPEGALNPADVRYNLMTVGKFKDKQEFEEEEIQRWVHSWRSRGAIKVKKEDSLFFFYCQNVDDHPALEGRNTTLNYRGAMLILKSWYFASSFASLNFTETRIWVKVEGLPFVYSNVEMAEIMLNKIGNILIFDEKSRQPGLKKFIRAKVWLQINKPLVSGCFLEYQVRRSVWVSFRYEGVFNFCKKCGKIGHVLSEC